MWSFVRTSFIPVVVLMSSSSSSGGWGGGGGGFGGGIGMWRSNHMMVSAAGGSSGGGGAKRFTKFIGKGSLVGSHTSYLPRGLNQARYVDYLKDSGVDILFGLGPAGCGKTLFACNEAVGCLRSGVVDRIVLTRPIVSVDEELGYLPGSILKKMDPWTRPMFDILEEFYSSSQIQSMIQNGVIEISPLAYMRGRTFKRAFIIADEMQNSSPNQMLMITTRLGEKSRMVVTGDLNQSDRVIDNGLAVMMSKIRAYESVYGPHKSIRYVEMDAGDIQRSSAVSEILKIYDFSEGSDGAGVVEKTSFEEIQAIVNSTSSSASASASGGGSVLSTSGIWDVFDNDAALIPKKWLK